MRAAVGLVISLAGLPVLPAVAVPAAAAPPGSVTLASHVPASPVTTPAGASFSPTTSADGAVTAFASTAADLVAGQVDANGGDDVFVSVPATGAVALVSHSAAGAATAANRASLAPSVSADGGWVVFVSSATDLAAGQTDTNNQDDVFLWERATGTVTLVSHVPAAAATSGNGASLRPVVSANGAYVAFESSATNLGATDTNNVPDVFVWERATGTVALVSHGAGTPTAAANDQSGLPSISADGGWVAFQSFATNLAAGQVDANNAGDVFLYERATAAVRLVSHTPASTVTAAAGHSRAPILSADGTAVVYATSATDAVSGQVDANSAEDVVLYDRASAATTLVSHRAASPTTTGDQRSGVTAVSAGGAWVALVSSASDLVAGFTDGNEAGDDDAFLWERATGAIRLVSHTPASATASGNHTSGSPSLAADGAWIAFESAATNLVTGQTDANEGFDVFVWERATGTVTLVSHAPGSTTTAGDGASDVPRLSADGKVVAFRSAATNLVAGQTDGNDNDDVFLFQRDGTTARRAAPADFDGDGDTDVSVFRPSTGTWFVLGGSPAAVAWGAGGDVPVPADYDGDGNTDEAVYRPSAHAWYLRTGAPVSPVWGADGDIPVPGDYDGDGAADVAVFRPSTGVWYLRTAAPQSIPWGTSGDVPVPADYDGDGTTDLAVFRPSTNVWYVRTATPSSPVWGASGDVPVPGDYDGDGKADIAVFRPATAVWYLRTTTPTSPVWGTTADVPVPGDYDGDGRTDVAVFRPATAVWYLRTTAPSSPVWGASGDVALPLPAAVRLALFG